MNTRFFSYGRILLLTLPALFLAITPQGSAQDNPLSNAEPQVQAETAELLTVGDIIAMKEAGLGDGVIMAKMEEMGSGVSTDRDRHLEPERSQGER